MGNTEMIMQQYNQLTEGLMMKEVEKMAAKAMRHWQINGGKWDEIHKQNMNEIHGALRIMSVVTGKEYVINDDGTIAERGQE